MTAQFIAILIIFVIGILVLRIFLRVVTIFEYERGLEYRRGKFKGILAPGLYWFVPLFSTIRKIDVRPAFVSIPGQEILSSDGVALKASLAAKYEVVDPETAVNKIENYQAALYLELQIALRQVVTGAPVEDLLGKRNDFGKLLFELTKQKAQHIGLRLLEVEIKDIMFPGEIKKIFTQVVKARQEGLAALEKARGETAALRSLANAAQLMERNPTLMQLRLLQVVGQNSGNTVVLGMPAQSAPIPIRTKEPQEIDSSPPLPKTEE